MSGLIIKNEYLGFSVGGNMCIEGIQIANMTRATSNIHVLVIHCRGYATLYHHHRIFIAHLFL